MERSKMSALKTWQPNRTLSLVFVGLVSFICFLGMNAKVYALLPPCDDFGGGGGTCVPASVPKDGYYEPKVEDVFDTAEADKLINVYDSDEKNKKRSGAIFKNDDIIILDDDGDSLYVMYPVTDKYGNTIDYKYGYIKKSSVKVKKARINNTTPYTPPSREGNWTDMTHKQFVQAVLPYALEGWEKYGVLPSITLAQAVYESGWGVHHKGDKNSYFGVTGGSYDSLAESAEAHNKLLGTAQTYSDIPYNTDYKDVAKELEGRGNYCPTRGYSAKLIDLIEDNDWTKYDPKP